LGTIDSAIELGLIPKRADGRKYDVLLIAPYRSQLDELTRQLTRVACRNLSVAVESVDAVQGREADFAIFSVTRSNSGGRLGFLGGDYWRRINVALSRARYGLTIVGDAEFCASEPGGLRRVLTHIRQNKVECAVISADVSN
jgi:superfamily I DNA and/or RNA helicase